MDARIERAIRIMTERSGHAFALRDVAEALHLSVSHFAHLFRSQADISPGRVLQAARLRAAQQLLENSDPGIKEIVSQLGFRDASHFIRAFKRIHTLTPSDYRASFRQSYAQKGIKSQYDILDHIPSQL